MTQDTDATVRDYAAEALERLGSPSAVRAESSAVSDRSKAKFLTRQGNQLFLGGKRFRAVGANGVGLFLGCLGVREYEQGRQWVEEALAEAGRRDILFLRVLGSGFWPADMKIYFDDPQTYWNRFDEFVALAKKYNVRLLPTLFWNYPMCPT